MASKIQIHGYEVSENETSLDREPLNREPAVSKSLKGRSNYALTMVKDIQRIIERCSHLTEQQKWDYCESQRYFIKQYLKNMNHTQ